MCGCGRGGKYSLFYLLYLQWDLQRGCANNTEVKGTKEGSAAWAHCECFDLYRQSKNGRKGWKCRGHGGNMKAPAEVSNIQDNRTEIIFAR